MLCKNDVMTRYSLCHMSGCIKVGVVARGGMLAIYRKQMHQVWGILEIRGGGVL